ncbi:MAG TPA: ABC transporter permease, partial [Burkholderiaceae bacterium]|nr:ABC transporter permease [Burkholderiaceae bacterium]
MTRTGALVRVGVPAIAVAAFLLAWEGAVRALHIPAYLLPAPSLIATTLADNFASLAASWWFTVRITLIALALAMAGGVLIAALFALSRTAERALAPFAVVLQVTPIVAIAPLIMILTDSPLATVIVCAWLVAFF